MSFLQPTFLWALSLLSIPLLIHLFNFRKYQRVVFSNVEMLKDIQTESRKTKQIKRWLILLSRLLALAFLVLAFAQPYIPRQQAKEGRSLVSIYLDNSESMRAEGQSGQLYENGKNVAREILQNLPQDAEVQVIDNAMSPWSNRVYTPENAAKLIDDLAIDHHVNNLAAVLQKMSNKVVAEGYASQYTYAISDFQKNGTNGVELDSSIHVNAILLKPELVQNLSIDSVWLEEPVNRPNTPIKLRIKVVNNGREDVESSTAIFKINGVQQGVESFGIAAKSSKELTTSFTTGDRGWVDGEVSISDVPIVFDNTYYFTLNMKEEISVLEIGEPSAAIRKVFAGDPVFELDNVAMGSVDYTALSSYDFIILRELSEISTGLAEALNSVAKQGGVLCVIPRENSVSYAPLGSILGGASYGGLSLAEASVDNADLKNPFLRDVYKDIPDNALLPKVKKSYVLRPAANTETILALKNEMPFLTKTKVKSGSLYQLSVPLSATYSNLQDHEIFVLSMLKMAFSKSEKQKLAYPLAYKEPINLSSIDNAEQVVLKKKDKEVIVENSLSDGNRRFWLNEELVDDGVYAIENEKGLSLGKIALNKSRSESVQRFSTAQEINSQIKGAKVSVLDESSATLVDSLSTMQRGTSLWKVFLALCLLFLLIEVLLLRFLKA